MEIVKNKKVAVRFFCNEKFTDIICKEIVSFLNTSGGTIVIDVTKRKIERAFSSLQNKKSQKALVKSVTVIGLS